MIRLVLRSGDTTPQEMAFESRLKAEERKAAKRKRGEGQMWALLDKKAKRWGFAPVRVMLAKYLLGQ